VRSWRKGPPDFDEIAFYTAGICFLGTPHQGPNRETWLKAIEGIAKSIQLNSNASIILRKSAGIEAAAKIDEEFFSQIRHDRGGNRLKVVNAYETFTTKNAGIVCHFQLNKCF
jgi:hypothetical protein